MLGEDAASSVIERLRQTNRIIDEEPALVISEGAAVPIALSASDRRGGRRAAR